MNSSDDDLLTALRAARPDRGYQPSPASPEATAMITRILSTHSGGNRAPRSIRRRLVLAGIPAVAGGAAVAAAVASRTGALGSGSPVLTVAGVRTGMLDAFERSSGSIQTTVQTIPRTAAIWETWLYPAFPQPGQQVRARYVRALNGVPLIDTGEIYVEPRAGRVETADTQRLTVSYAGRTWSESRAPMKMFTIFGDGSLSPAAIRKQTTDGGFRVAGTGRIAGRQAIKLSWATPEAGYTTVLWVDAMTFLVLRAVLRFANGPDTTINYQILPANSANLKLLTPPIPAGFTRTGSLRQLFLDSKTLHDFGTVAVTRSSSVRTKRRLYTGAAALTLARDRAASQAAPRAGWTGWPTAPKRPRRTRGGRAPRSRR